MSAATEERALATFAPQAEIQRYRRARILQTAGRVVAFLIVLGAAITFVFPVYWMVVTSLKSTPEVFHVPPVWWPAQPQWGNYPEALANFPFLLYASNTLRIALPVVAGTTISSALVAYGFARLRWRGREIVFYLVLATLMIPSWVTLVPLYILFNRLGWV